MTYRWLIDLPDLTDAGLYDVSLSRDEERDIYFVRGWTQRGCLGDMRDFAFDGPTFRARHGALLAWAAETTARRVGVPLADLRLAEPCVVDGAAS